jgi:malate dehydrogenase (oxaloacetate-decarboxylating)
VGIPIGKLALYAGCGGVHPATTLPTMLDVGTENPNCLDDPLSIGWRQGGCEETTTIILSKSSFAQAVKRWPHVLLQWEDFARNNATRLIERCRDRLCAFNNDVQRASAVAAGTLLSPVNLTGAPLAEQRIAILGAGSAGCGIASLLRMAMMDAGLSDKEAGQRFFRFDREGLLVRGMPDSAPVPGAIPSGEVGASAPGRSTTPTRSPCSTSCATRSPPLWSGFRARPAHFQRRWRASRPITTSGRSFCPMSNPTSRSEATPEDLDAWSGGKAIIGTGPRIRR